MVEQIAKDLGINNLIFKTLEIDYNRTQLYLKSSLQTYYLGEIKILDDQTISFELNLQQLVQHATLKKTYKPASKYPPITEDLALITEENIQAGDIIDLIKKQSLLITTVSLLDKYEDSKTFHIIYQSYEKNLTNEETGKIREKILKALKDKLNIKLKE